MHVFIRSSLNILFIVHFEFTEEFDHDELIEPEGGGPSLFGDDDSFILRVDIQNKSFASGETMEHAFSEFFDNIAEKENGQQLFGKKPVHAILIPERKGKYVLHKYILLKIRKIEQFATSGDSPNTIHQDVD